MSQSSWQIGRPDLNAVFLTCFFFFFFLSSRCVRFESITALKYGTCFWMNKIHTDTRPNTELKKSVVQSVSLGLPYLFLYILTSKFIKHWEKKISKQKKIQTLNFAESNTQRKTNARGSFEIWDLFFVALSVTRISPPNSFGKVLFWVRVHRDPPWPLTGVQKALTT